jgi:ABC-2 type transport system ATP-binding protein
VLQIRELRKSYGATTALEPVSFELRTGEIVGLIGPNGAGKTTTLNMILGVLAPTSGTILINGFDITRQRARALARSNFAAVYAPLPGNLTVEQNLRFFGMIHGARPLAEQVEELLRRFNLTAFRNRKCGVLSSGEQTRVCIAKAMLNQPRLLLLDEPTASLDPATAQDIRRMIREIADGGDMGILWTSHNMYEVTDVCDRVVLLARGRVLLTGDPKTLPEEHGAASLEALFIRLARASTAEATAEAEAAGAAP